MIESNQNLPGLVDGSLGEREYHVWSSVSMRRACRETDHFNRKPYRPCFYKLATGEVVQIDNATKRIDHGCNWDDMVYLGVGTFSHLGERS